MRKKFVLRRQLLLAQANRAGRIALARESNVIELKDWLQATPSPDQSDALHDSAGLQAVSVSDEVIRRVVHDEAKGTLESSSRNWRSRAPRPRKPPTPNPDD